jgi:hypothetical protein
VFSNLPTDLNLQPTTTSERPNDIIIASCQEIESINKNYFKTIRELAYSTDEEEADEVKEAEKS